MILTGKALDDFESWFEENRHNAFEFKNFRNFSPELINAKIIIWLNTIKCVGYKSLWNFVFNIDNVFNYDYVESTRQAIIKANEIYNSL